MKTYPDCIPCFFKQALGAARLCNANEAVQKKIINQLSKELLNLSWDACPSEMGRIIYRLVREISGNNDPFKGAKEKSNKLALKLLSKLEQKISTSEDRLLAASELAIAGNVIDYGIQNSLSVEEQLDSFIKGNFNVYNEYNKAIFAYQEFKQAIISARRVLYIGDNAGEIVFDRLLLSQIKEMPQIEEVVYTVKEGPIINDALKEDAAFAGIDEIVQVVSSGCDAPGTILKFCSEEFLSFYNKADLIISKGQGNFEALSREDRPIYFFFMAKCQVVARHIGCRVGDIILARRCDFLS